MLRKLGLGAMAFLILLALLSSGGSQSQTSSDPAVPAPAATVPPQVEKVKTKAEVEEETRSSAAMACEMFVKNSLHDPESAEFDDFDRYKVSKQRDGVYRVLVTLRARNGFNALRHGTVECRTKHSDLLGGWTPVSIKGVN